MFDRKKPTVQMLGRWQPWHKGHTELFKRALSKTGQVAIMIRNADGDNNPFDAYQIRNNIVDTLSKEGFFNKKDYIIIEVPNIVDISYGRKVGYTFTEYDLGEEIHNISSTKIRKNMREKGELS
jgi:nicotinamide mononucleotide adenylyltransferase|tara:strand:+ start:524 stop:895 length:372 start_codon:yes stop_codon:yes gene_type:complete